MKDEFVYLAKNPAYKDDDGKLLIKIGLTSKDINQRMKDLSKDTGVPKPFECIHLFKCKNAKEVEDELHFIFKDLRYYERREFFAVDPKCVVKVLSFMNVNECDLKTFTFEPEVKIPRKKIMTISKTMEKKIIALSKQRLSYEEIATRLNTSVHHVGNTIRQYKIEKGFTDAK